jgi:hypothetical protein
LRRMAELARGSSDPRAPRAAAWQSLAEAERLAGLSAFEPERNERVLPLIDLARRVLLVQAALARPAGGAVADALDAVANRLDSGAAVGRTELRRGVENSMHDLLIDRVGALQRAAEVV